MYVVLALRELAFKFANPVVACVVIIPHVRLAGNASPRRAALPRFAGSSRVIRGIVELEPYGILRQRGAGAFTAYDVVAERKNAVAE
jgi:hypothetical protein